MVDLEDMVVELFQERIHLKSIDLHVTCVDILQKILVAAGLADRCEVQLAYAIGVAEPVSLYVNTFGTNKIPENQIEELVRKNFDMKPSGIISQLDLKRPIYKKTACLWSFWKK